MKQKKEISQLKFTELDSHCARLIESVHDGKEIMRLRKGATLFAQGADADAIYFIQSGKVKVTVTPVGGKEIELAVLEPADVFGEGCLVGQSLRTVTATAIAASLVVKIEKEAMLRALQAEPELSETFIAALIVRTVDLEENICRHLFSDDEKRLAHVLLKLHRYGRTDFLPDATLSQLSDEALANLAGIPRGEIKQSLARFKSLRLIENNGNSQIAVRAEMMTDMVLAGNSSVPSDEKVLPPHRQGHLPAPGPTARSRKVASLVPFETVRKKDRKWDETPTPGIWICRLFDDVPEKHGAILVKMAAGAIYPDHQHKGREQFYVIDGDVRVGTDSLLAGDYHRAEASTYHRQVTTESGCMCIILGYVGSISSKQLTAK